MMSMTRMKTERALALAAAAALLLATVPAYAVSVFLNGVKIDGVTNQKFENCSVELDAQGNVHIKAKGYQVQVQQAPPQQPPPPTYPPRGYPPQQPYVPPPRVQQPPPVPSGGPVTRRYFMVSEMAAVGMAQYEIDIFINSVWVRKVTDEQEQQVFEVTRYLRSGRNVVHFTATKPQTARRSNNPGHYFKVIFGEGNVGGDNVMIDNPLIQYRRNAAELQNFNDDYVITAR